MAAEPQNPEALPTETAPSSQPLLLDAEEVAELLNIGVRSLHRLDAAGALPSPVRLGRSVRWNRAELVEWLAAGAPDRATWNRLKTAKGVRR